LNLDEVTKEKLSRIAKLFLLLKNEMKYFCYVLRSTDFSRNYIGFTSNIENRLEQHNSGKTKSTRPYKPWKLLFYEVFDTKEEAIQREKWLKSGIGREYIKSKLEL
jgi:putative endonuclease